MLRYYTQEELNDLFEWFDENLHESRAAFFKTLAYTGLRLSEVIRLEWSAVNLRRKEIWVLGQTKSKKKRVIPINERLQKILKSQKKVTKYVFDNGSDRPMLTGGRWFRILGQALKECRIKGANLHTFRHTFASHLVMAGVNLRTVQELLGHSDIKTTLIYAHLSPEHLKDTVSKLPY